MHPKNMILGFDAHRLAEGGEALAPSFAAHYRGRAPAPAAALERSLAALYREGREAFPDVELAAVDFAAFAGERARDDVDAAEAVRELRGPDLFLACACSRGLPAALRAFDRTFSARLPDYLRKLRVTPDIEEETRASLLEKLFTPIHGNLPHIAQYSGRGALEGWVRVAAVRTALNIVESRKGKASPADEDAALANAVDHGDDPELLFLKASYRAPFAAAFREALAELPPRERTLLRFAFVEGLTPERIGKLHGVHRTTVMRWLGAARAAVLEGTRGRLVQRLHLSPSECEDLFEVAKSRFDVTLSSLLRSGG
jgi:RNA polymerase sigma-70 factor (ECF subfamily)